MSSSRTSAKTAETEAEAGTEAAAAKAATDAAAAARGPMTLADLLCVAEDLALREGRAAVAWSIRDARRATLLGLPPEKRTTLTPEEVLIRCGLDPAYRGRPNMREPDGRTTRMLAEAVSVLSTGVLPELVGHDRRYTDQLYRQLFDMAIQCGLSRTFVDHYVYERERWVGRRAERAEPQQQPRTLDTLAREAPAVLRTLGIHVDAVEVEWSAARRGYDVHMTRGNHVASFFLPTAVLMEGNAALTVAAREAYQRLLERERGDQGPPSPP